jgi:hypothetical protein
MALQTITTPTSATTSTGGGWTESDDPIRTVGMSHVRYDAKGKVIFHQDYWDTGAVYEKIPVMGAVIRWIKNKF